MPFSSLSFYWEKEIAMKKSLMSLATAALLPALLTCVSCKSDADNATLETKSTTAMQQGVPGGVKTKTHTLTATVTDIDASSRTVTFLNTDGKKVAVKCGPEVVNFDQIHVGDKLKVVVTDQTAIYMATTPPVDGAVVVAGQAPKGAMPGAVVAGAVQTTATVTAIDTTAHTATLRFSDGTIKTVPVRQDVDLTQRKVGEQVVIRVTEAMAISVEKP